ncbi:MAG: cation transporter [Clostridia bacterium]|nr:cation transporter [Clostridia bacterium]
MKENKIIIITAFFNLIVAFLKLISGITFSFSTLIADSIQSFIDFFTDITSIIANKVGKRRANKTYPFGYGQVYYLANLFTGFLLFLIGIFILYQFFFFKGFFEPNISIAIVLMMVLFLKMIVIKLLQHYGKEFKSVKVIKMSSYYSIFLQVRADENITIKEYLLFEKKVKSQLKNINKLIRFIDIELL